MKLSLLLVVLGLFLTADVFAQKKWEPEEFTNSVGTTFMVYPREKAVLKEKYDLAVKLCNDASALYKNKKYDEMKAAVDRAFVADPNFWKIYLYRGLYYWAKKDYIKSNENYELAISYSFEQSFICGNISSNCINLKQYDKAFKYAKKDIALNKKSASSYHNLGHASDELGLYEEAIEAYTKAIDFRYSDRKRTHNNRGVSYKNLKKYDEARQDYRKALEIDPDYQLAKDNLAALEEIAPSRPGTLWLIAVGVNNYRNNYKLSPLSFPTKGAYEFARIFETKNMLKERATILTDAQATRKGIIEALDDLHNSGKVKYNDMVMFYFSGHGEMAGESIGICPHDYDAPRDLISDGEISKRMNRFAAKHKVAIIEACKTEVQMAAPIPSAMLKKYNEARQNLSGGLAYITSTRAGKVSYGSSSTGGYFTTHLRKALDSSAADVNNDKVVSLREMFEYARKHTSGLSGQLCHKFRSLYFVGCKKNTSSPYRIRSASI